MTIKDSSVNIGSDVTLAIGSGTNAPFTSLANPGKTHEVFFGGTDYSDRMEATFKVTMPKANAGSPNGYTQARAELFLKAPIDDSVEGINPTMNTGKVYFSFDRETAAGPKRDFRKILCQLIMHADFDDFWENSSAA